MLKRILSDRGFSDEHTTISYCTSKDKQVDAIACLSTTVGKIYIRRGDFDSMKEIKLYSSEKPQMFVNKNTIKMVLDEHGERVVFMCDSCLESDNANCHLKGMDEKSGKCGGYVYVFSTGSHDTDPVQIARLAPKYLEKGINFGASVAISDDGNVVFVSAPKKVNDQSTDCSMSIGAVYTFVYNEAKKYYRQDQLIRPPKDSQISDFGKHLEVLSSTSIYITGHDRATGEDKKYRYDRTYSYVESRSTFQRSWIYVVPVSKDNKVIKFMSAIKNKFSSK